MRGVCYGWVLMKTKTTPGRFWAGLATVMAIVVGYSGMGLATAAPEQSVQATRKVLTELQQQRPPEPNFDGMLERRIDAEETNYVASLFAAWDQSDDGSALRTSMEQEMLHYYQSATRRATERSMNRRMLFAGHARKLLIDPKVTKAEARFLKGLCATKGGIGFADVLAGIGIPTEPWGWDIQDTYSLALLKSGDIKQARRENKLLLRKAKRLNTDRYLHRYQLSRALIEAHAGNPKTAAKYLKQAAVAEDADEDSKAIRAAVTSKIRVKR